jgi:hypothetical protein
MQLWVYHCACIEQNSKKKKPNSYINCILSLNLKIKLSYNKDKRPYLLGEDTTMLRKAQKYIWHYSFTLAKGI